MFKYTGFVGENVNALGHALGLGRDRPARAHLVLPVGISFYTFKAMSYAIDVYRGDARPMRRFTDYLCFEAFFPDLVAGPIIRYAALEEQMRVRAHTLDKFARGVAFFAFGMAKKIADRESRWGTSPTPRSRPARSTRPTRGSAWWATRSRSTSISPATPTWRAASRSCSASS